MAKKTSELFTSKNVALFNMLFRHQVYLEGVALNVAADYKVVLRQLYDTFATFLAQNRYSSLNQYTLGQLNQFVAKFQREQGHFYSVYTKQLIETLKEFLSADLKVNKAIFSKQNPEKEPEANPLFGKAALSTEALWPHITLDPIPANGQTIPDYIDAFTTTASATILNGIKQAYANSLTNEQAQAAIVGNSDNNFRDGLLSRLLVQNAAFIALLLQHISTEAQAAIASSYYSRYVWVSILDNKTTLICRTRNGNVYVYGVGPLPPAHYFCRSKPFPFTGEHYYNIPLSYGMWLKQQPEEFIKDVLGASKGAKLLNGELQPEDFSLVGTTKPLTIAEFVAKIKFIL